MFGSRHIGAGASIQRLAATVLAATIGTIGAWHAQAADQVPPEREGTSETEAPPVGDDVEEMTVTAPGPESGQIPPLEYLLEVYDARSRGADLYRRGRYDEAFPYLLIAAKRGFKFAQARVAFLYQQGLGTPQDPEAAVAWLGVASRGETMPEILNYFNDMWRKIPESMQPDLAALIDEYEAKYGTRENRVACDRDRKAGTFVKSLTCRFMDEHLYTSTSEDLGEITALEIETLGG